MSIADDVLETVISEYTREAGVRQLERELGSILRKTATKIVTKEAEPPVELEVDAVRDALGRQKFFREAAERTAVPGVATGLAVNVTGGDVLFVEATAVPGEGLVLTGQLGDVMKESAQIALSAVRSQADRLGIDQEAFERKFHVHVPAGAIPKDGPSAGITMTTALASLLSGRPIKHTVGMTGEVTLQGRVLPIGGLKQKVLAAHAAGSMPSSSAWPRTYDSAMRADSFITSPSWPVRTMFSLPGIEVASMKSTSPPVPVTDRPVATPGTAVRSAASWKTFWRPSASRTSSRSITTGARELPRGASCRSV